MEQLEQFFSCSFRPSPHSEPSFPAALEQQAVARIDRLGQTQQCYVFRYFIKGMHMHFYERFIIIDIPARTEDRSGIVSSLGDDMREKLADQSDALIPIDLLKPYEGVVHLHLPHGYEHISEFAHVMFGVRLAVEISALMPIGRN